MHTSVCVSVRDEEVDCVVSNNQKKSIFSLKC